MIFELLGSRLYFRPNNARHARIDEKSSSQSKDGEMGAFDPAILCVFPAGTDTLFTPERLRFQRPIVPYAEFCAAIRPYHLDLTIQLIFRMESIRFLLQGKDFKESGVVVIDRGEVHCSPCRGNSARSPDIDRDPFERLAGISGLLFRDGSRIRRHIQNR